MIVWELISSERSSLQDITNSYYSGKYMRTNERPQTSNNFGAKLRRLRWASGLTIGQVALLCNIDRKAVELGEMGCEDVSIMDLALICELLGADIQWLLERTALSPLAAAEASSVQARTLGASDEFARMLWRRKCSSRAARKLLARRRALLAERKNLRERAMQALQQAARLGLEFNSEVG